MQQGTIIPSPLIAMAVVEPRFKIVASSNMLFIQLGNQGR